MNDDEEKIKEVQERVKNGTVTLQDLAWVITNFVRDFRPLADEIDIIRIKKELGLYDQNE